MALWLENEKKHVQSFKVKRKTYTERITSVMAQYLCEDCCWDGLKLIVTNLRISTVKLTLDQDRKYFKKKKCFCSWLRREVDLDRFRMESLSDTFFTSFYFSWR